ncbi:cation:proton antiporter [Microbacterium oxydans]|nr:cation:proton antiporter [Microbacterium oxydans]
MTLAAALLPRLLGKLPISIPMVFLAAGIIVFALIPDLPDPHPSDHPDITLHLTEICVLVSLMGAGLAINRPLRWRTWSTTWRLLAITMPLSIAAVAVLGWVGLGLGAASALLLAAALAPTDPVLATEVQVSEPVDDENADDEVRFALTSEAGLNDGLAFPFTYAAIAISMVGLAPSAWFTDWFLIDVLWRITIGVIAGIGTGWLFGKLFFSTRLSGKKVVDQAEGFVAIAAIFLAYGIAETAEGYGFIAVFVCAVTIRASERGHGYHQVLHKFVEQIERLLTIAVVVLLGGAIARGLFADIGWIEILVALLILLIIRPLAGWIGLTPGKTGPRERTVIAFFGVRGVGSLFYIAYATQNGYFPDGDRLWSIVGLVIVGSIIIHGLAATPTMRLIDATRHRVTRRRGGDHTDIATTPV